MITDDYMKTVKTMLSSIETVLNKYDSTQKTEHEIDALYKWYDIWKHEMEIVSDHQYAQFKEQDETIKRIFKERYQYEDN